MRTWLLIIVGTLLVSLSLLSPNLDRNLRAAGGVVGGLLMVIGLAPGRQQHHDPRHRVYRHGSLTLRPTTSEESVPTSQEIGR
mgnify:FL=1